MDPSAPRIAVVFNGDVTDRRTWSGTPFGVYSGLQAAGAEVVTINARLPGHLHRALGAALGVPLLRRAAGTSPRTRARSAYSAALIGPEAAAVQSRVVSRALGRIDRLDGIVQIGSGFFVAPVAPLVTYEDMTIRQALEYPYTQWDSLTPTQVEARIVLQSRTYAVATGVCMTNSWAVRSAIEDYGVPEGRAHSVGVGSHEARRTPARQWSPPRFLFVGLDWERKNGPRVLRAFARIRESVPEARLDLVGGHPPVTAPGVVGHGWVSRTEPEGRARLEALFDSATCFVMPSLFEPSAVVYTEALAVGLPSIGTGVGGSADLIGDAGYVIDPTNDDELYAAMLETTDPGRARELSRLAAARADRFTWRAVAERLLRSLGAAPPGAVLADYL